MFDVASVNEELRINQEIRALADPELQRKTLHLYGLFLDLTDYRVRRAIAGMTLGLVGVILGGGSGQSVLQALLLGVLWFVGAWWLADFAILRPLHRRLARNRLRQIGGLLQADPGYAQALLTIRRIAPVYTRAVSRCWRQFVGPQEISGSPLT